MIFDGCSQRSCVTESLQKFLGLQKFGESHAQLRTCEIVQLAIEIPNEGRVYVPAYVVPTICSHISNQCIDLHERQYNHLQSLKLADTITNQQIN